MKTQDLKKLMGSLSLHEKIGQLVQLDGGFFGAEEVPTGPCDEMGIAPWVVENAGSVLNVLGIKKVQEVQRHHLLHSRIPLLFMADVVYGYKTSYPIPLALACSWDMELVEECAKKTAYEAAADGAQVTFSPMVDIVRDARWGRCLESPGEDPYLNSRFARAMVKGFQNDFTPGKSMASCVKHYAGYGAVEAGREYNTVDMSRWRLMQEYLPPYQAAVDADCKMVMTSFNTVEGIPSTANQWLMQDVLREKWGFDGVVITDYAAIQELVAHGVAENDADAAKLAMDAGVDIDMRTPCYHKTVYSGLRLSDTVLHSGGVITAQVNVQNTGDIAGDEVVQLYICDRVGSVVRPVQELKGFQRIHLEPKECRTVTFEIIEDMLKFYNAALEYTVEPGMFDVMVGPSSVDVLTAGFQKN